MIMEKTMKNTIVFGLLNVLVDKQTLQKTYIFDYLEPLSKFCKNNNKDLYLVTGLKEKDAKDLIDRFELLTFFDKNKIINLTEEYEDSLSDLDKKLKQEKHEQRYYVDEYFKVFFFKNICKKPVEDCLYVGFDVWVDGYYLRRYANVDFLLIKDFLKNNGKLLEKDQDFYDLHILNPSFDDFKKHLTEDINYQYESLDKYSKKYLHTEILGKNFNIFSNKSVRDFVIKQAKKRDK